MSQQLPLLLQYLPFRLYTSHGCLAAVLQQNILTRCFESSSLTNNSKIADTCSVVRTLSRQCRSKACQNSCSCSTQHLVAGQLQQHQQVPQLTQHSHQRQFSSAESGVWSHASRQQQHMQHSSISRSFGSVQEAFVQQPDGWSHNSILQASHNSSSSNAPQQWHSPSRGIHAATAAYGAVARPHSLHPDSSSSSILSSIRHLSNITSSSSGAPASTRVHQYLPSALQPYAQLMRLDKPIGSWLLAWPGLWTIALATPPGHLPDLWLTTLFGVGAVLMRGAGCTINDLWDKDIDKQVDRTRTRPLAAGTISQTAALAFLAGQLSLSLAILLQLNLYTQVLGVCSLALVATYPLMKRITWWPQAFLGLCMNYGVLMGYSAAAGACDWSVVLPMYAAGVNWTLVYDTIYAHQDKKDDAIVGVKSTALLFGDRTKQWSTGFAILQTLGLGLAGQAAGCGLAYYAAVTAGAAHQAWQIRTVDLNNGPDCMAKFVSNKWYGAILYAGIVADRLLAA